MKPSVLGHVCVKFRSTDHVSKIRPPISETPCIFKTLLLSQQLHTNTAVLIFKSTSTFKVQNILQRFIYCIFIARRDSHPGNDLFFVHKELQLLGLNVLHTHTKTLIINSHRLNPFKVLLVFLRCQLAHTCRFGLNKKFEAAV